MAQASTKENRLTYYDEQLQVLQEEITRARQLSAKITELKQQQGVLRDEVCRLSSIKYREQAEVDQLEGRSLAAFFFRICGKLDEKLDQERREAYAARVKCDAAERELTNAEEDLRRYEIEYSKLRSYQKEYAALLAEKAAAVKSAGGALAEELLRKEEALTAIRLQQKELQEAVYAGNSALSSARRVLDSLNSAEGWSSFDLMGGGLFADMAKYSHLDRAQESIEGLQSDLRRFKTELADVHITADLQISVDGFLRFADFFFDNLFTDWAVRDKIHRSQSQVEGTIANINDVLRRLSGLLQESGAKELRIKDEIDQLVRQAQL